MFLHKKILRILESRYIFINALRLNYMSLVHKWNDISEYWYHIIIYQNIFKKYSKSSKF